jgi:peptide/nickel transport system substrate-binding protein
MRSPWKLAIAAGAAAILSLSVVACSTSTGEGETTALRIGLPTGRMVGTFDPTTAALSAWPTQAVYETLFQMDTTIETGGFAPGLATGYERSEDWKTVTLTLQEGVTFTDGEEFTAGGLKTYLEGMAAIPEWAYKSFWDLSAPTLEATDDTTLVITSETPMTLRYRGFLHVLFTSVPIASPASLEDLAATAEDPIGSGPYVIDEWIPEVSISFVRNEDYWNEEAFPYDTLEYTLFEDDIAALNALKAGQIDAAQLPLNLAAEAENEGFRLNLTDPADNGRSRLYSGAVLQILDREGTVNPALADKRVRQAMALAFDREAISDTILLGYGGIKSQIFSEGQDEYVPGGDERYGYDPERAKELLAEAGYPDGFDLTILSTPFTGINQYEPAIAQFLGDIGIRVTFDTQETNAFFTSATMSTAYPALIYGDDGGLSAMPVFLASDALFNPFKVQDSKIDDLWGQVQTGPDDVAKAASAELGEYVLDESFLIVFAASPTVWATAPGLTTVATVAVLYRFQPED